MQKIPVAQAVGKSLCHDVTAIMANGFKGVQFHRGHIIQKEDVSALMDIGKYHVYVGEVETDHLHEDDASLAITHALLGENVSLSGPSEGKCTVTADAAGLFILHRAGLRAINAIDDVTIATRPNYTVVAPGDRLAGARIVPLTTHKAYVNTAILLAKEHAPVLTVVPFQPLKTGVIITGSEVFYGRVPDAFEPILTKKLTALNATILGFTKCPDDEAAILAAAKAFHAKGADVVLFTGGMSVDPDDLTPGIIKKLCTEFITQGVPMQPGNMLTMGYRDTTFLMGIPGATMHSNITSCDLFLPRVFAGHHITKADIADLGEGGLCLGCKACHYPICYFGRS